MLAACVINNHERKSYTWIPNIMEIPNYCTCVTVHADKWENYSPGQIAEQGFMLSMVVSTKG